MPVGSFGKKSSTSCRWMKRFSDSPIAEEGVVSSSVGATPTSRPSSGVWPPNEGRSVPSSHLQHSLLVVIYTMLKRGQGYQELGAGYFEKLQADDFKRYLVRKLEAQGYTVTLQADA